MSITFNYNKIELLTKDLESRFPEIDGVEWKVFIDRSHSHRGFEIRVLAGFHTDTEDIMKELPNIGKKLHQITSAGQIELELE